MILAPNLGRTDRTIRIALGVIVGVTAVVMEGHSWLRVFLGLSSFSLIVGALWGT